MTSPTPGQRMASNTTTCRQCTYALQGLPLSGVCPECGTPVSFSELRVPPANLTPPPEAKSSLASLRCVGCGYSLEGLAVTTDCPECGLAIEQSSYGYYLQYAPREYLQTLLRGHGIVMVSSIVALCSVGLQSLVTCGASPLRGGFLTVLSLAVTIMAMAAMFYGMWMMAAPDPRGIDHRVKDAARQRLRNTSGFCCVCTVLYCGAVLAVVGQGTLVGGRGASTANSIIPLTLAGIAGGLLAVSSTLIVLILYMRVLAARVPDTELVKRSKVCLVLVPLFAVLPFAAAAMGFVNSGLWGLAFAIPCFLLWIIPVAVVFGMVNSMRRHLSSFLRYGEQARDYGYGIGK